MNGLSRLLLPVSGVAAFVLLANMAHAVPTQRPEVVRVLPHDSSAFTQGLLLYDGLLYESTGLRGRSSLRRVNPEDGVVLQSVALPAEEFGEGLARVGDRLVQLTWQEQVARVYDLESLEEVATFSYPGEGWGLCFDGARLVMSDGSDTLYFRDPHTFELVGSQAVKRDGAPVQELNELECVHGLVLANVWQSDVIVVIDPESGEVLIDVDAAGLLSTEEAAAADVLNGIAFDPESGRYLLTGKLWPKLFEVEIDVPRLDQSQPESASSCSLTASRLALQFPWFSCALVVGLAMRRRCY